MTPQERRERSSQMLEEMLNLKMAEVLSQPSDIIQMRNSISTIQKVLIAIDHRVAALEAGRPKEKKTRTKKK